MTGRRAFLPFAERYGKWALVAGASEGLGAAFAENLATRGMNLVLVARREHLLAEVARRLREKHGVDVRCVARDLADPGLAALLRETTADVDLGVLVYNAAFVPVGRFADLDGETLERVVRVNAMAPAIAVHALLPGMRERGRGAVVLVSSLAGLQGTPHVATYAATKAFNIILAEGLWAELRDSGIDVIACCAGAMPTPGYAATVKRDMPGMMAPGDVARRTLAALGRGPRVVPGTLNRVSAQIMSRLLPRRAAIRIIGANTEEL